MTKILNFGLKIKGGGREGGTCEILRPCQKKLKRALEPELFTFCWDFIDSDN